MCQTDGDFLWIINNIASLYRMKLFLVFMSFVFSLSFSFGQEVTEFVLYGKVYDTEYKEPIPYVKVAFNGQDTYTNTEGEFSLKVKYIKEGWVEFIHVGFKEKKEILTNKMVEKKVVSDTLFWSYTRLEGVSLGPVTVQHSRWIRFLEVNFTPLRIMLFSQTRGCFYWPTRKRLINKQNYC